MRLLVSTDGSERSLGVLSHAGAVARTFGAELLLLQVAGKAGADVPGLQHSLQSRGLEGQVHVVEPVAGEETEARIARFANANGVDLIAMSTRGAGAVRHALGSVTIGVLRRSTVPIMIGGPQLAPASPGERLRVVVTNDGSMSAEAVLPPLTRLAGDSAIEVTLLRVFEPRLGDRGDLSEPAAEEAELARIAERLPSTMHAIARVEPAADGVSHTIATIAESLGADAIAMASRGHSASRHLFAGSVALGVVDRATMPVILVRA